jgi:peptidoglycan lytic transglycosylase G
MPPLFGRGDEGRERSAADREAARVERERRRALREGRPPTDELPATGEPRAPAEPASSDEPPARAEPASSDEPPARAEPASSDEPPAPAEQSSGEPPAPAEPTDAASPFGEEPDPDRSPFGDEPELDEPGSDEPLRDEPASARLSDDPRPRERDARWEPFATEPDPEPVASQREALEADPEPDPPARDRHPPADDPQATQPLEPVGAPRARRTVSLPHPQTEELGHHTDSWERPIGTVRRSRAEYQAQPGAPGMPPHRNLPVRKPRRLWLRRGVALLSILALAAVAVFAFMLYQPFHGKGYDAVVVKIPPGASAGDIGDLLAKNDIVDSGFFFALRARVSGDRGKLRAGTYTLKRSMSYSQALAALTEAPAAAATIDVTLPEGPSRRELAPRVKAAGVRGNYVTASERSSTLRSRDYGAPKGTRGLEGFLFPDTYELGSRTATAKTLVTDQLRTFKRQFATLDLRRAKRRNLSRYDVLIIASMIEREALVAKDRPLIAAVIYNRLRKGMPLGIDATLRYRLNNWSRPLRRSELNTNSAYNTGKTQGLPPTPIGNPGLASLKAAAAPASVKYLFYVVKPCGNGAHAFSSSDAQFQKDVAAYDAARKKRGGKDPSRC